MRQSTTEDIARATGKESPANPPMVAPVPVGTIMTPVYGFWPIPLEPCIQKKEGSA